MLFLLTGDVQIGKTRWLERLVVELAGDGVLVSGVLAPSVWRKREPGEGSGHPGLAGAGRFEKLGIDNVLVPSGERIPFARRRDLALAEGSYDAGSQSAKARMGWEIADEALARVNSHFAAIALATSPNPAGSPVLATSANPASNLPATPGSSSTNPATFAALRAGAHAPEMFHVKHSFAQTNVSRETSFNPESLSCMPQMPGLLVVDELGQLELLRDGGLTEAVALLDAGATDTFPHALVVVRDWLLSRACERFGELWGGVAMLAPGDEARFAVRSAFGLASLNDNKYH